MAWTFSGAFLEGLTGDRVVAGTGEPEELPGKYAIAGLVDAHAHPTVTTDEHGPYLIDGKHGAARLEEYAEDEQAPSIAEHLDGHVDRAP